MKVVVDDNSGFCFGVVKAINTAEEQLKNSSSQLNCLGEIVHNNEEVERLEKLGLKTIHHQDIDDLSNQRLLIRAHGEPPTTYKKAKDNNVILIDATCPVVLKLQEKVLKGYKEMNLIDGQILIYGKKGHAEVNGLVGQTENSAIVLGNSKDITQIDFSKPARLYSQTTQNIDKFHLLSTEIENIYKNININSDFKSYDTICRQVSNKTPQLIKFANSNDVIIFVSGYQSSNGKYLFEVCKKTNSKTFFISKSAEIRKEWFDNAKTVGVCGATSTPMWLMKEIAIFIEKF